MTTPERGSPRISPGTELRGLHPDFLSTLCHERWVLVCQCLCRELGFVVLDQGPGMADFRLARSGVEPIAGYVSCFANSLHTVTCREVQKLHNQMQRDKIREGTIFSLGPIEEAARRLFPWESMELYDPEQFQEILTYLQPESQRRLAETASYIKMECPICTRCGSPMDPQEEKGMRYWRCSDYPRCACTFSW